MNITRRMSLIIEGWGKLVFKDPRVEEVMLRRAKICSDCDSYCLRPYLHCRDCGCYLPAKLRSMGSECPLGKWTNESLDRSNH